MGESIVLKAPGRHAQSRFCRECHAFAIGCTEGFFCAAWMKCSRSGFCFQPRQMYCAQLCPHFHPILSRAIPSNFAEAWNHWLVETSGLGSLFMPKECWHCCSVGCLDQSRHPFPQGRQDVVELSFSTFCLCIVLLKTTNFNLNGCCLILILFLWLMHCPVKHQFWYHV